MAIAFRQITLADLNGTSATSLTATFSSGILAGSVIVAFAAISGAGLTITIADGSSDAATDSGAGSVSNATEVVTTKVAAFFAPTTGVTTVTASWTGAQAHGTLFIYEVTGLTSALFDKVVHANGTGTAASSGSTGTLSASAEACFGFGGQANVGFSAGGGGNWLTGQGSVVGSNVGDGIDADGNIGEHQIVAVNTAITGTATETAGGGWTMWCVTVMSGGASATVSFDQRHRAPWAVRPRRGPGTGKGYVEVPTPAAADAPIVVLEAVVDEVEFEASDFTLDGAIQPVLGTWPEIVTVEAVDDFDFDSLITESFSLDGAISPVFADQAEIVTLDAVELDPDEYDVGFFLDEAIAPVFADGGTGLQSFYDVLPLVTDSLADDGALFTPTVATDNEQIVVVEAVDDFEEQVIEGATDDGAIQPVFADQAEIGLVDSDPGEVEFEASDLALDGALQPVYGDGPEIVLVDSDPGEIEFEAADLTLDEAIGPVFAAGPEVAALDAEPVPDDEYDVGLFLDEAIRPVFADTVEIIALDAVELDLDEYDVGFFLDEAIGAVFGVGTEIIALDAQDDAEEIVTEGATDDAALFTAATTSDNEQIVVVDAEQPPDDEYDAGLFLDGAVQAVFADQAEINFNSSDAGEDEFEAADATQTGPFDDAAAGATDVPTGPLSVYDVLGQLSGARIVIPDGAPQEGPDNEQIVFISSDAGEDEFEASDAAQTGPFDDAPAGNTTDVPTGPLSIYDVLALVTDSAHEPILIENTTDVPDNLRSFLDLLPFVTDSFADDGALFPPAVVPPDITEIVALQAEDDFVEQEGLALVEEKPGFDAAPPPATAKSEWLIRARRRGRR